MSNPLREYSETRRYHIGGEVKEFTGVTWVRPRLDGAHILTTKDGEVIVERPWDYVNIVVERAGD